MNVIVLVGRLTKDPELRYTSGGVATCSFTLAVDNPFGDKKADFINIVVWRQLAETCATYLKKGRLTGVEGRITTRNYEKDGRKVYVTEVVANNVRFLESIGGQKQEAPAENEADSPITINDDDLPF